MKKVIYSAEQSKPSVSLQDVEVLKQRVKDEDLFAICYRIRYPKKSKYKPGEVEESIDGLFEARSYRDYYRQVSEIIDKCGVSESSIKFDTVYNRSNSDSKQNLAEFKRCLDSGEDADVYYDSAVKRYLGQWLQRKLDELNSDLVSEGLLAEEPAVIPGYRDSLVGHSQVWRSKMVDPNVSIQEVCDYLENPRDYYSGRLVETGKPNVFSIELPGVAKGELRVCDELGDYYSVSLDSVFGGFRYNVRLGK